MIDLYLWKCEQLKKVMLLHENCKDYHSLYMSYSKKDRRLIDILSVNYNIKIKR